MILFPILIRFNDLCIERELSDFDSNITKLYQFSLVTQLCLTTLCDLMDCSMQGFPVHHQLLEFTQTHVL